MQGADGEGGTVTQRYGLRDDQRARIEPELPGRVGYMGGIAWMSYSNGRHN